MKKLFLALLFGGTAFGAMTQVQDVLYRADGSTCAGTMSISWPTFTSSDGHLNVAGRFTRQVRNGIVSVTVEPGNYYTVTYSLVPAGCAPTQEYWNVPVSATPVNLAAVRSLAVPVTPPLIALSSLAQTGANNFSCIIWSSSVMSWTAGSCSLGVGTVTTISGSGPSWLTWNITNPTSTPVITLSPTTGQTPHRVIGTCGAATTFGPCALVAGDLPSTAVTAVTNDTNIQGSISAQNLTFSWAGTLAAVRMVNAGVHTGDCTTTFPNCTISASAITLAKMANLAANSIICNNTGSAATPLACTRSQIAAMLSGQTLFTLTTTGTTGAATYSGGTLNIPQYTGGGGGGSAFTGSTASSSTGITGTATNPILSLADQSVKSPVRFEPAALAANVASVTFNNKTAGAKFSIAWTQATSGGPYGVTYGASVAGTAACQIDQTVTTPGVVTTQFFEVGADGTTVNGTGCSTTGPGDVMRTDTSNTVTAGTQDLSAAAHTLPEKVGTIASLPATCTVGEKYFANNATAGQNDYFCTATNTWTQQLNSGGGGGTAVAPYTTTVTSQTSVSITAATHGQGTVATPWCFDNSTPRVAVACGYTRNTSGDLVFTFSPAFTGQIEIGSGGGISISPFSSSVSAQTSVSITAATHGHGITPRADCFNNSSPALVVACSYTRNGSGDLVFSFSPAFTGTIEIRY